MLNPSEGGDRLCGGVGRRPPASELLTPTPFRDVRGFHWEAEDQRENPPGL